MLTLKEIVDDLESSTHSSMDIKEKLLIAGIKLDKEILDRCSNCPLARYFSLKLGQSVKVSLGSAWPIDNFMGEFTRLGNNTCEFRQFFDDGLIN